MQVFLEKELQRSAQAGTHNFLRLVSEVLERNGFQVAFCSLSERAQASGRALTHMKAPTGPCGLVFRRVYHYPFWQIEQSERRWDWDVAHATFDPRTMDGDRARRFQRMWRKRLFRELEPQNGDTVYVPLQGKIRTRRSFQSCAPIAMLEKVLAATDRPVVIGLHPKEVYSKADHATLSRLVTQHPRAQVQIGGMEHVLPNCHAVVTQNSSAAFNGYFFGKPAVLFAKVDFHHVSQNRSPEAAGDALERILAGPSKKPYAKYLHWFWQERSINAGREDARARIAERFARFGWFD